MGRQRIQQIHHRVRPGSQRRRFPDRQHLGSNTLLADPTGVTLDPSGDVWVSNIGNNSITEYARGHRQRRPDRRHLGGATGLSVPYGIALDPSGNLFAANAGTSTITEYAPGSTGNVAPIAIISGEPPGSLPRLL